MQHRYDNNFSYEFLDRLQEEYECCDELWYRSNMHDRVPMSCFRTNGLFDEIYDEVRRNKQASPNYNPNYLSL